MKIALAVVFVAAGVWLFITGYNRKNSVAGAAAEFGTKVANKFDGKARTPEHTMYMVGGGALILIGAVVGARALKS